MFRFFLGLAVVLCAAHPSMLKSEGAAGTIEQLNTGTLIFGAPLDKKALLGKVVVMELWGMG